jgi:hypothetical protein
MKFWATIFAVMLVGAAATLFVSQAMRPSPIVAAYGRLYVGMPLDEVEAILGKPLRGGCESDCDYVWEEDGYVVVVTFDPLCPAPTRITSKQIEGRGRAEVVTSRGKRQFPSRPSS